MAVILTDEEIKELLEYIDKHSEPIYKSYRPIFQTKLGILYCKIIDITLNFLLDITAKNRRVRNFIIGIFTHFIPKEYNRKENE